MQTLLLWQTIKNIKEMKNVGKLMFSALVGSMLFACGGGNPETEVEEVEVAKGTTGTFEVNTSESTVKWAGDMLAIGGVSLYGHDGTIKVADGKIMMTDGAVTGGTIAIDMKSIEPMDENYTPEEGRGKGELIGHLSSPDFFAVDSFPMAKFEVLRMEEGNVVGNLTVRGVTNEETIENVTINETENGVSVTGQLTFDRQKYGVAFSMANAYDVRDKVVSDDIKLSFEVNAAAAAM
jgi:polyisoprenoid-binding protein YceI